MIINILGCAGWMPSEGRETASLMIRDKKTMLLLDAGTGISNLKNFMNILPEYDIIHIILSHFHLDHTIGISYLCKWFKDKKIVFYIPQKTNSGRKAELVLYDLINRESFVHRLDDIASSVEIIEYSECIPFKVGDLLLKTKSQIHSSPCFAVKINDLVCYATDTIADQSTFKWACNVQLMFHECWSEKKDNSGHSSFEEIFELSSYMNN